jgi:hypothetical protein
LAFRSPFERAAIGESISPKEEDYRITFHTFDAREKAQVPCDFAI